MIQKNSNYASLYCISWRIQNVYNSLLADDLHTCLMVIAAGEVDTLKLNKSPHTCTHLLIQVSPLFKFVVHPVTVGVCGQLCLDICFSVSPERTGVGVSSVQTRFCSCRARPHTRSPPPTDRCSHTTQQALWSQSCFDVKYLPRRDCPVWERLVALLGRA